VVRVDVVGRPSCGSGEGEAVSPDTTKPYLYERDLDELHRIDLN
jgi:hypothetical protein